MKLCQVTYGQKQGKRQVAPRDAWHLLSPRLRIVRAQAGVSPTGDRLVDRGDVDDLAAKLSLTAAHELAAEEERFVEIRLDDIVEVLEPCYYKGLGAADAGAVDENIGQPKRFLE